MAQVKVYGHAAFLHGRQQTISDAIHAASRASLGLPENKRFHRFFPLADENFIHPADRSGSSLILEVHLFRGRSPDTLRQFIRQLQRNLTTLLNLTDHDLEITLIETPAAHWGLRGQLGDELQLPYEVNV